MDKCEGSMGKKLSNYINYQTYIKMIQVNAKANLVSGWEDEML